MNWTELLSSLTYGVDLTRNQSREALGLVMAGEASQIKLASLLTGLASKGPTTEELTGLVEAMRSAAVPVTVEVDCIDTAGTGGDRSGTFNISTAAALIAAGAGAKVAKHGNRSASSRCGSADVLEQLGLNLECSPTQTAAMVAECGFGFFFAPLYHPAMRHVAPVRTELGFPTVFNFLGPLSNPAGAKRQIVGVFDPAMALPMLEVLQNLGTIEAMVFYGSDGLDEITLSGPSTYFHLRDDQISQGEINPTDLGYGLQSSDDIKGGDARANAQTIELILAGQLGPPRQIAVMNAAPALVVAGLADNLAEGVKLAELAIDSGAAQQVLADAIEASLTDTETA